MSSSCGFKGIAILDEQSFEKLLNLQANSTLLDEEEEKGNGFSVFYYLLSVGNQYYERRFGVDNERYFQIAPKSKTIHFCTSMRQKLEKTFVTELNKIATSIVMRGITEFDPRDLESVYLKNVPPIADLFSVDIEKFNLDMEITDDGIFLLLDDPTESYMGYGCIYDEGPSYRRTHDKNWELVPN